MNAAMLDHSPLERLPPEHEIRHHLGSLIRELKRTRKLLRLAEEINVERSRQESQKQEVAR